MPFWDSGFMDFIHKMQGGQANAGDLFGAMQGAGGQMAQDTFAPSSGGMPAAAPKVDTTQSDELRAQQMQLIKALQAQAAGQGPSLAQAQLGQATDANMRGAMSMGAAQQGQGLGHQAALRGIGDQRAAIQQQAAGQSSMQRMMEQMQAQQQLAGVLGGTRGQDMSVGSDNAHLGLGYDQLALQKQQMDAQNRVNPLSIISGLGQAALSGATSGLLGGGGGGGGGGGPTYQAGYQGPNYATGGVVDSPANDTVPAMLSPGEIVLPLSVTQSEDPAGKAAAFVEAVKAQKRARGPQ